MSDDDMIRRGDALASIYGDRDGWTRDAISDIPAATPTLADALAVPEVRALVEALRVNLTFSEKIAEVADIDLDETALSVLIQPRGETVGRRTWAGVIGEGYAALAPFTKGGDA